MTPERLLRPGWYVYHKNLIGYLVLVAAVLFVMWGQRENSQDTKQLAETSRLVAVQTHSALCTLRADLQRRVADSEAFLEAHPEGVAGISKADIQRSITGQRSTIRALAIADC